MAYSTINKPEDYFNTKLYTGDGNTTQAITGVGFQPDWLWIKHRNGVSDHQLSDIVRGKSGSLYYQIQTNGTSAQSVQPDNDGVHSLDSDGFTVGYTNSTAWNQNTSTYAAWNWLAGGTPSSNTDGSITSSVSANTTAGFSIVTFTSPSSASTAYNVGHGLSSTPKLIFKKPISTTGSWTTHHGSFAANEYIFLDSTAAKATNTLAWGNTLPTSSLFYGNSGWDGTSNDYVAYCFSEVKGYSKFGTYTGNGNNDGTFVYTGFKPAMIIIKDTSAVNNWRLFDNKRPAFNQTDKLLFPSLSNAETVNVSGSGAIDITSNGFKCRSSASGINGSGSTFIYMAIAERSLVGTNNIPALAR